VTSAAASTAGTSSASWGASLPSGWGGNPDCMSSPCCLDFRMPAHSCRDISRRGGGAGTTGIGRGCTLLGGGLLGGGLGDQVRLHPLGQLYGQLGVAGLRTGTGSLIQWAIMASKISCCVAPVFPANRSPVLITVQVGNLMPTALPIISSSSMMSNTPCLVMSSLTTKLTQWLSSSQHSTRLYRGRGVRM
jgi:hypothetical protein